MNMPIARRLSPRRSFAGAFAVAATLVLLVAPTVGASVTLLQVSSDPYTNSTSQHRTEVEPDTFSFGSTIVSAFQVGRFFNGGASNIGFATSSNGGKAWTSGDATGPVSACQ